MKNDSNTQKHDMKKVLLIIPILLLAAAFTKIQSRQPENKSEIDFFKGSWSEAVNKAKVEKKAIFLDIYATWCGPCKLLKKQTFTDKNVAGFYNTNFINVSLDGETGDGALLAQKYQIPGYPTLIILDFNETPVHATAGFLNAKEFMTFGKQGLKKIK